MWSAPEIKLRCSNASHIDTLELADILVSIRKRAQTESGRMSLVSLVSALERHPGFPQRAMTASGDTREWPRETVE